MMSNPLSADELLTTTATLSCPGIGLVKLSRGGVKGQVVDPDCAIQTSPPGLGERTLKTMLTE